MFTSKCLIFFAWLSLSLVEQASSRTCYVCESSINETCSTGVDHDEFQMDCVKAIEEISKSNDESLEYLHALIKGYSTEYPSGNITDFECVTFVGRTIEKWVVKACIPKTKNCNASEDDMRASGFLSDSCDRCDGDVCNKPVREKVSAFAANTKDAKSRAKAVKSDSLWVEFSCAVGFLVSTFLRLGL